jgi:hypothetical protein
LDLKSFNLEIDPTMRQFATVSISPWANPYNGATNTGQNYYTSSATKQPVYRRSVAPPPRFNYPGVEQVIDVSDEESGRCTYDMIDQGLN